MDGTDMVEKVSCTCQEFNLVIQLIKSKKTIPLQASTDPGVSRRLRFPDFKTIGTLRW